MTIDLTPLFQAVIAILAALVTYKLIPWIKARTTEQQQATLSAAVKIAVYAAEEIYKVGNGSTKLKYAQEWLRKQGYNVDLETINAAVLRMRTETSLPVLTINEMAAADEDIAND